MTPFHSLRIGRLLSVLAILALLFTAVLTTPVHPVRAAGSQPSGQFTLLKDISIANLSSQPDTFFSLGSRFLHGG